MKMMTNSYSRFNTPITGALLRNLFYSIKYNTPSEIKKLNLNNYDNVNNESILKAADILRRYLSNLPFLVKEISVELPKGYSSNCNMNDALFKPIASNELTIQRKTSTKVQNTVNNLEVMIAHLFYLALQLYFFGGRKNTGNNLALTYANALTYAELNNISQHKVHEPEPVSCDCPLIFGYIIPVKFFGNPFGLQSYCRRKHAHISYSKEMPATLENCTDRKNCSCLKPIGFEVKSKNATSETSMDKLQCNDQVSNEVDIAMSKINENTLGDHNCHIHVSTEFEIAPDDGNHPLLDFFEPEKKDPKTLRGLENLLGHAFSENKKRSSKTNNTKKMACNPPCSVWCDSVKARDQDTADKSNARKFYGLSNDKSVKMNLDLIKPFYPKNFSTNNPHYLKYEDIQQENKDHSQTIPNILPEHSVIREDLSVLKEISEVQVNRGKDIQSRSLSDQQDEYYIADEIDFAQMTYLCQRKKRSTWSFVEDKNSLWQPLPDCLPCDNVPKQHIQKRMRDFRRQKSLN